MIDSVQFRIRIGSFDLGRISCKANKSLNYNSKQVDGVASFSLVLLLYLSLGFSLLYLDMYMKSSCGLTSVNSSNQSLVQEPYTVNCTHFVLYVWINGRGLGTKLYPPLFLPGVGDWNTYMRAINGNSKKNTVTLAHWNASSSFLGKSERGREKLREIENYLHQHKIDILGVSEANLDNTLGEYEYKIQGYSSIKSGRDTARVITYIREDLIWKELKNYGNNLACTWLEVGKGRNKLVVCMYYREFKLLGVDGSNSVPEQVLRLEEFMNIITKTRNIGNVVIL